MTTQISLENTLLNGISLDQKDKYCMISQVCGTENCMSWGWRDGSAVKSTDCSSRGPEFNSQQLHGGSQPSVMGSAGVSKEIHKRNPKSLKKIFLN